MWALLRSKTHFGNFARIPVSPSMLALARRRLSERPPKKKEGVLSACVVWGDLARLRQGSGVLKLIIGARSWDSSVCLSANPNASLDQRMVSSSLQPKRKIMQCNAMCRPMLRPPCGLGVEALGTEDVAHKEIGHIS